MFHCSFTDQCYNCKTQAQKKTLTGRNYYRTVVSFFTVLLWVNTGIQHHKKKPFCEFIRQSCVFLCTWNQYVLLRLESNALSLFIKLLLQTTPASHEATRPVQYSTRIPIKVCSLLQHSPPVTTLSLALNRAHVRNHKPSTAYSHWGFSRGSSPGKCLKLGHDCFLPHPFRCIIPWLSYLSLTVLSYWQRN
jgi:hypothetical protein